MTTCSLSLNDFKKQVNRIKHTYELWIDELGNKIPVDLSDLQSQGIDEKSSVSFKTPKKRNRTTKETSGDKNKTRPYKTQCSDDTAAFENMDKGKVVPASIKVLLTLDLGLDEIADILDSICERFNTSASKISHTTSMLETKMHLLERAVRHKFNKLQNNLNQLSL